MRICLVTETYTPEINGVAKTLDRLTVELSTRGHAVHVVRPRQKSDARNTSRNQTIVTGLPIPGYQGMQFGLPAAKQLTALWTGNRPDIIYVATEGPLGWSAISTANKLAIPVVSGFHTNFHSYSKHYKLGWLENIIFYYLKKTHNRCACTLAPSPLIINELKQRGITSTELFTRGVDTETYHPKHRCPGLREQLQIDDNALVALYVGRIAAEKNINLVIKAYHAMRNEHAKLRLVMVGDGPLLKKLKASHPDIIFTGLKTGIELSQHYASADIFLFASETETFGNVILEAMSSGLAVIAYDYAASHMHIHHSINGYTVELGNQAAFCNTAINLVKHQEDLYLIRQQARTTAEHTDWKHAIDHFEKVLVKYVKSEIHNTRDAKEPVSADGQL